MRRWQYNGIFWIVFLGLMWAGKTVKAHAATSDSIPRPALVFVEGKDEFGRQISRGIGVIVKKNFVAVNYHVIAGMKSVSVFKPGDSKEYPSDGYLSAQESMDLVIISVPGIGGQTARLSPISFPEDGTQLTLISHPDSRSIRPANCEVRGTKEILDQMLPQLISQETEDCTSGPVFREQTVVGFVTAGYLDDRYYAYVIPSSELRRLMNRSFIIKAFNSLTDPDPIGTSYYQKSLMESLTAVLWLQLPDAERLARKKGKMLLINVYTNWAGWSKLMDKNTYSKKRIIRYINENFYAVRLNAETTQSIDFNKLTFDRKDGSDYHTLAYSLLEGKMDFPSTVFLDENINVLLVIPGYMNAVKMEVVLHYFHEKAYKDKKKSFREYEQEYLRRANNY